MRFTNPKTAVTALVIALSATACSSTDPAPRADSEVEVIMTDNAFEPSEFAVVAGETVTFKFSNSGTLAHDAFIGDAADQEEHGQSMDSSEDMEGHNMDGGDALLIEPGETGELTYTFEKAGDIIIGCHQPGHYEAGMKSTVTVS